jgi:hypothetical protein
MSEAPKLPPIKIAFIIDNKVVDVLHTDERLGAIFLSDPVIVDVTDQFDEHGRTTTAMVDATYNPATKTFTPLATEE